MNDTDNSNNRHRNNDKCKLNYSNISIEDGRGKENLHLGMEVEQEGNRTVHHSVGTGSGTNNQALSFFDDDDSDEMILSCIS